MPNSNIILASLSAADAAALQPHLKNVRLESKTVLYNVGDRVDAVFFPAGAVISLVVGLSTGEMIESSMIGNDGVVGVAAALDSKISLTHAVIQLSGPAFVCDATVFKTLAMQS